MGSLHHQVLQTPRPLLVHSWTHVCGHCSFGEYLCAGLISKTRYKKMRSNTRLRTKLPNTYQTSKYYLKTITHASQILTLKLVHKQTDRGTEQLSLEENKSKASSLKRLAVKPTTYFSSEENFLFTNYQWITEHSTSAQSHKLNT